jgi:hypothetical protein
MPPLEVSSGREESGLVASGRNLEIAGDQTAPLATIGANSGASSAAPVLQAVAQLSGTMLMLTEAGELGFARAVHEAIGKLLMGSGGQDLERGAASAGAGFRADIRELMTIK